MTAYNSDELLKLKLLAESIRIKLEAGAQQFLFKPEEIVKLGESGKKYKESDYIVRPSRNKMAARIFSDIVLARVANPVSKHASVDMLEEDFGVTLDLDKVYRMMDRLDADAIDRLKAITYQSTGLKDRCNILRCSNGVF